jgi:BCD family chlorophyll transporter-like MFS transporter
MSPSIGYSFVYHIEIYLLFATLVALGPLVMYQAKEIQRRNLKFGLAELPV